MSKGDAGARTVIDSISEAVKITGEYEAAARALAEYVEQRVQAALAEQKTSKPEPTKLEMVARIFAAVRYDDPDAWQAIPRCRTECLDMARAAVQALKNPSEAQIAAWVRVFGSDNGLIIRGYNAMLQAILSEVK